MKIQIWSIGKAHEPNFVKGIEDFSNRLQNYFSMDWRILPPARQTTNTTEADVKKTEATTILTALKKDDYLILLDERGKQLSSPGLANLIQQRANASTRNLVFIIGGAFGVHESVIQRANTTWALSQLVFPHQLVRLMLAEQLYRACTILRNEKYHHV